MNRLNNLEGFRRESRMHFTDGDLDRIREAYDRNPADVACPLCGPGTMELIAYVEPAAERPGRAEMAEPLGEYVAVLYCHSCTRSVGVLVADTGEHESESREAP